MDSTCKLFRKIGPHHFEPAYNSLSDFTRHKQPGEVFCANCNAVVVTAAPTLGDCPFCSPAPIVITHNQAHQIFNGR